MLFSFFATYIQPYVFVWKDALTLALTMTPAKYVTLAAWLIYWLGFFVVRRRVTPPMADQNLTVDNRSKGPLARVVALHFLIYAFFWIDLGKIPGFSVWGAPLAFVGFLLIFFGAAFSIISRYYLGSAWSFLTITSVNRPLVKEGPYSSVRHPIYLGLFIIWLGASLMFLNWLGLVSAFLILLPLLYKRARIEEENLIKTFGNEYRTIIESTGLLFPKF